MTSNDETNADESQRIKRGDEDVLLAYPIEWEDVRKDMKYPSDDDNDGFIYGIQWMDGEEISDITWYKTENEREYFLLSLIHI